MTREEQRTIEGKLHRVIIEEFEDGSRSETIIPIVNDPIPSLAVFDKTTGHLVFAMESNRADVDKTYSEMKDTHHCVKDICHKVRSIENYRHDGTKLVHKKDSKLVVEIK